MLLLMLIGLLAGLIQIVLGLVGVGRLIKYIPYSVVCGYLSGVGLTIIGGQLPRVLGVPREMGFWQALTTPSAWHWQSIVVGTVVVATMALVPRVIRVVPAAIIAMLAGVAAYLLLGLADPALWTAAGNPLLIGPLGVAAGGLPDALLHNLQALGDFDPARLPLILLPALTLAALLSIDTLKTCVVLDALTSTHHDPDRELLAQGLGNAGSALLGGIPGAGQMGASMVNLASGAQTRRSGTFEGVFALAALLVLAPLVAWIPIAALGGILLLVGYRMIDQHSLEFFQSRTTRFDFFVIVAVILTALTGLVMIGIGVVMRSVILVFRFFFLHLMGLDALAGHYLDPLETGGGVEALQPTLETEAVADQQFGVSQSADILRRWLIDVSIAVRPDQH